jgi:hypothetical protein
MKPMTKMQACGCLCDLTEHMKGQISYHERNMKEEPPESSHGRYHKEHIDKYNRWIRAIEMAGVALTR